VERARDIPSRISSRVCCEKISARWSVCEQAQVFVGMAQPVSAELIFRHGTPPDAEYTFKHQLLTSYPQNFNLT
jgi:hypothetical protein